MKPSPSPGLRSHKNKPNVGDASEYSKNNTYGSNNPTNNICGKPKTKNRYTLPLPQSKRRLPCPRRFSPPNLHPFPPLHANQNHLPSKTPSKKPCKTSWANAQKASCTTKTPPTCLWTKWIAIHPGKAPIVTVSAFTLPFDNLSSSAT